MRGSSSGEAWWAAWRPRLRRSRRLVGGSLAVVTLGGVMALAPFSMTTASFTATTDATGSSFVADALDPPTGLVATVAPSGRIDLSWTPTVDAWASGYTIYRTATSGSGYVEVASVAGRATTSYVDTLAPAAPQYYVLRSNFLGWSSGPSNEAASGSWYATVVKATTGLVGYWRLGADASATLVPDSFGRNDGVPAGGLTFQVAGGIANDPDTAVRFNGSSGRVDVGNGARLRQNTGTVEVWMKTTGAGSGYRDLVGKDGAYYLLLRDNVLGLWNERTDTFTSSGRRLDDGQWHHVVLTFQAGVTNGTRLYVDGVQVQQGTIDFRNQDHPVWIGGTIWNGGDEYFNGTIDEVAIYDRPLTAATILNHYEVGRG